MTPRHLRMNWASFLATYLVAMHLLLFANLFLAGGGIGTPVLLPFAAATAGYAVLFMHRTLGAPDFRVSALDLAVTVYLLFSTASLVLFLQDGNPASFGAYLYGLNVHVLPMTLYFAARGVHRGEFTRLLQLIVGLQVFAAVVGIVLFLTQPDFYTDYLRNRLGREEDWQLYARLQSYVGSTGMGILSAASIVLLLNLPLSRLQRHGLLLVLLLTVFLTQQRGAYVAALLATGYFLYRSRISATQVAVAAGVFAVLVTAVIRYFDLPLAFFADVVDNRIVRDWLEGDPLGERAVSWRKGMAFLKDFPFGLGVGATTSAAHEAGAHIDGQVVDAYYMRVAADLGVLGFLLFVLVLAVGAWSGLRNRSVQGFWVIVAIFAFQSIGTNVLDSFLVAHVFWLLLGWVGATPAGAPAGMPARVPS